jgi:isopenicillin N synthase-like dioxygenase
MSDIELPVINLGPYFAGSPGAAEALASEVDAACSAIGFLVLDNHGISRELIERVFASARTFFERPLAQKRQFCSPDPVIPRGYQNFGERSLAKTLGQEAPPDLREQYFMGPLNPDLQRIAHLHNATPFYSANIWPDFPTSYRETLSEFYCELEALGKHLMRIFALALKMEANFFADKIDNHFSTGTVNNYPAVATSLPGQLRTGAHTDFGSLTILAVDDAPGALQVRRDEDTWIDIKPAPDQLIINLGDMMARWTNDRWRSTVHRVANPPADSATHSHRMSAGYFLHPNFDAEIRCLPTCVDAGMQPRFAPILAGEHMREKLRRRVV